MDTSVKFPKYYASCPKGMEQLLDKELARLSIEKRNETEGGIIFETDPLTALDVILKSRVASRVYKRLFTVQIAEEQDIYKLCHPLAWEDIFNLEQRFKIQTSFDRTAKEYFRNSMAFSLILKDAIVDRFRNVVGQRPDVDTKYADVQFFLRLEKAEKRFHFKATILLDLCGSPLSNRGYRKRGAEAPLRENLAAGIVESLEWDHQKDMLIDSMCGSGTLLIEAALIKARIPPSYIKIKHFLEQEKKPWAFLKQKWFVSDAELAECFKEITVKSHEETKKSILAILPGQFFGIDRDQASLTLAVETIKNAGLNLAIDIQSGDATQIGPPKTGNGVVICNPPYGERLGEVEDLEKLYYEYGENLKRQFKGFKAYIFTANADLRKKISLKTSQRIPFKNGNLECRLLKYDLF